MTRRETEKHAWSLLILNRSGQREKDRETGISHLHFARYARFGHSPRRRYYQMNSFINVNVNVLVAVKDGRVRPSVGIRGVIVA